MRIQFLAAAALLLVLCGCGVQGPPLPPSLELPEPVKDLAAVRKADKVTLTWTQPRESTDKIGLRHIGATKICTNISADFTQHPIKDCKATAAVLQPKETRLHETDQPIPMKFEGRLSPESQRQNPTGSVEYALEVDNLNGRAAGLSNQVTVPLAPTLPPPGDVRVSVDAEGVHISATHAQPPTVSRLKFLYRIYRHAVPPQPKEIPALVAEIPAEEPIQVIDVSFAWEQRYSYHITPATSVISDSGATVATAEGNDSESLEVLPHDVYPPATPTGLQAVYSGLEQQRFVDLTWNPNSEGDLAGYNIYRHEQGDPAVKINSDLAKTPAFRDASVQPGHTYFYSISALDLRNNESPRSAETSEAVPQ